MDRVVFKAGHLCTTLNNPLLVDSMRIYFDNFHAKMALAWKFYLVLACNQVLDPGYSWLYPGPNHGLIQDHIQVSFPRCRTASRTIPHTVSRIVILHPGLLPRSPFSLIRLSTQNNSFLSPTSSLLKVISSCVAWP